MPRQESGAVPARGGLEGPVAKAEEKPAARQGWCLCLGRIAAGLCCWAVESAHRDRLDALDARRRLEAELEAVQAQSRSEREELLGLLSRRELERERLVVQIRALSRASTPIPHFSPTPPVPYDGLLPSSLSSAGAHDERVNIQAAAAALARTHTELAAPESTQGAAAPGLARVAVPSAAPPGPSEREEDSSRVSSAKDRAAPADEKFLPGSQKTAAKKTSSTKPPAAPAQVPGPGRIALAGAAPTGGDEEKQAYAARRPIERGQPPSLLVVDTDNHRVMRWFPREREGELVAGGCGPGNGLSQLKNPTSIALGRDGSMLIVDLGNDRVVRWEDGAQEGRVIAGGNGRGDAEDQLNNPTVVTLDKVGALVIVDLCNHRIVRWPKGAKSGQVIAGGNGPGPGLHQLDNPTAVCLDPQGAAVVSDLGNNRIVRWAPGAAQGEVVAGRHGSCGPGLNELSHPTSVVLDGYGRLLISDAGNNRVLRWTMWEEQGQSIAGGRDAGPKLYQLKNPAGLLIDGGSFLVADLLNNRVMRWEQGKREGIVVAGGRGKGNGPHQLNAPTGICLERLGGEPIRAEVPLSRPKQQSESDKKNTSAWMVEGPGSRLKQLQQQRELLRASTGGAGGRTPSNGTQSLRKMNETGGVTGTLPKAAELAEMGSSVPPLPPGARSPRASTAGSRTEQPELLEPGHAAHAATARTSEEPRAVAEATVLREDEGAELGAIRPIVLSL